MGIKMTDITIATAIISPEKFAELEKWREEQRLSAIEHQKKTIKEDDPFYDIYVETWEMGYPYGGAIGGGEVISITGTSLGDVVTVKCLYTNAEINVTDYESW
jgi:hypothetical protein